MSPITPYGGHLPERTVPVGERERLIRETANHPAHTLTPAQLVQLEALVTGVYAPLSGYLSQADYQSVLANRRLVDGTPWPLPIALAVPATLAATLAPSLELLLRDEEGTPLALLTISELWQADRLAEADLLYGTTAPEAPAVAALLAEPGHCLSGTLAAIQLPKHYDFTDARATPAQIRALLSDRAALGYWLDQPVCAILHNQLSAMAKACNRPLLLVTHSSSEVRHDLGAATRARLTQNLATRTEAFRACLVPHEARVLGARELGLRLILMRNYGCAAVALEPGLDSDQLAEVRDWAAQVGVELIELPDQAFDQTERRWCEPDADQPAYTRGELLEELEAGRDLATGMVAESDLPLLRLAYPPRAEQGVVLFFTGLSGAGKSTVAKALYAALGAYDKRVTLLDGDIVRLNLSKGLGFSKEDRDINILRIGYVASLIAKSGGWAICAPIAPYRRTRAEVRRMVGRTARFVEVHVATDLATCESRDPKGLYARARAGQLKGFTGIDDPYEAPESPELRLDTGRLAVEESIAAMIAWLQREGYLS